MRIAFRRSLAAATTDGRVIPFVGPRAGERATVRRLGATRRGSAQAHQVKLSRLCVNWFTLPGMAQRRKLICSSEWETSMAIVVESRWKGSYEQALPFVREASSILKGAG